MEFLVNVFYIHTKYFMWGNQTFFQFYAYLHFILLYVLATTFILYCIVLYCIVKWTIKYSPFQKYAARHTLYVCVNMILVKKLLKV